MFMLSTGCRAIRNPLQHIEEFDSALGIGAMSDKDADDRHMSRLICMPAMLRRQLDQYFQHCLALTRHLIGYLPHDEEGRWSRGFFLPSSESGIARLEIRPAIIPQHRKQVPGYIPHRISAFRKFFGTKLAEVGSPLRF